MPGWRPGFGTGGDGRSPTPFRLYISPLGKRAARGWGSVGQDSRGACKPSVNARTIRARGFGNARGFRIVKFLIPWRNKSKTAKRRPRISRWRQAKAEPVQRIPLSQSGPIKPTNLDYAQSLPSPVDSSLLYRGIVPDPVTSIILTGTSDAPSRATSVVSGNEVRSSPSNGQSREPREPSMDTLPERLRRVLAPPLGCLLPGPIPCSNGRES